MKSRTKRNSTTVYVLLLVISQALWWLLDGLGPTCILAVISLSAASASACLSANCRLCSPAFCFRSSTNALASVNLETPACQVEVNAESVLRQIHLHITFKRKTRRFINDLSKVSRIIGRSWKTRFPSTALGMFNENARKNHLSHRHQSNTRLL